MTYFSFVEPWGYEDNLNYFTEWQDKIKASPRLSDEVYMHREILGYSKEMRYVELITITGKNGKQEEREDVIDGPGLFPSFEAGTKEA
jgi:hypothetical protein